MDKPKGRIIAFWPCIMDASRHYNISQVNISYNVNGRLKQAKGHYFRFATPAEIDEYNKSLARIDAAIHETPNAEPLNNIEQADQLPPAETIPEAIEKAIDQDVTLSPFERMLQECKKKFNDNSN